MSDETHEIIDADAMEITSPPATQRSITSRDDDPIAASAMAMLQANPTPETAEKILDFLERLRAGKARESFARAMIAMKADMPPITKDGVNTHTEQRYSSLDGIMRTIRPTLTKYGFDATWKTRPAQGKDIIVICKILHVDGHSEECESPPAPPDTGKGRSAVQAVGSSMSYLSRYTLLLALGITPTNMPDADDNHEPAPPPPDSINTTKTNELLTALRKRRITKEESEEWSGMKQEEWTIKDLHDIWQWAKGGGK